MKDPAEREYEREKASEREERFFEKADRLHEERKHDKPMEKTKITRTEILTPEEKDQALEMEREGRSSTIVYKNLRVDVVESDTNGDFFWVRIECDWDQFGSVMKCIARRGLIQEHRKTDGDDR